MKKNKRMKKEQNKTLKGALIGIASLLLIAGVFAGGMALQKHLSKDDVVLSSKDGGISTDISSQNMRIRALATKENEDGSVTKTFTYEVQPAGATDQEVTVKASYVDGSDCSAVITTSVDQTKKEISVTNKGAFNKVINVVVTSVNNSKATATIKCDYVKKVLDVSCNETLDNFTSFVDEYITPSYSIYTKDKNYTFAISNADITISSLGDTGNWSTYKSEIETKIETAINQKKAISNDDLWNIHDTYDYHNFLVNGNLDYCMDPNNITLTATVTAENFSKNITVDMSVDINASGDELFDFTPFEIPVTGVTTEVGNLEF